MNLLLKKSMKNLFVCPIPKVDKSLLDFSFRKNCQVVL